MPPFVTSKMTRSKSLIDLDTLVNQCADSVAMSGIVASEIVSNQMSELWASLKEKDKRELAACGLTKLVNDEMARRRRESAALELRNDLEQDRQKRDAEKKAAEVEWNNMRARQSSLSKKKKDTQFKSTITERHRQFWGKDDCGMKRCQRDTNGGAGSLLECVARKMDIKVVDLADMEEKDWNAALSAHKDKSSKIENENDRLYRLHSMMNCDNMTCRQGRYPGPNGQCAHKWLGDLSDVEAEKTAAEWGARNKARQEEYRDSLRGWIDRAVDHGYQTAVNDMKSIMLMASDGTMKSLFQFNAQDVQSWSSKSETMTQSWTERRLWFDSAKELMNQENVDEMSKLSSDSLSKLGKLATHVWKEKEQDAPIA